MTIATDARAIVVPGRVEILLAVNNAYTSLFHLGESEDGIQVTEQYFWHDVPGDRYGGNAGAPTEKQFLGMMARFNLRMSRWDPAQVAKLENVGGLLATNGLVPLASIGAVTLAAKGMRLLLNCTRDSTRTRNYPCCIVSEPISVGKSSKYSTCALGIEAHRTPEGFWGIGSGSCAAGVVWDTDVTGTT